MAAQRAAGDAFFGRLNEQPSPSALGLPAAKAALVAVIQNISNAAAVISMISLMAYSCQLHPAGGFRMTGITWQGSPRSVRLRSARSLHKSLELQGRKAGRRVSIPARSAYD